MTVTDTHREAVDRIIEARWLIPVQPRGLVLEDAAVAIRQGRIVAILPIGEMRQRFHAADTSRLTQHALIPGLVNLHTHAAMTPMRGLADDRPLMEWLEGHIWPAEAQAVSSAFVHDGTLLGCAEMLAGGITCFNDMYFHPQAAAEAVDRAGIRACLGLVVLELASPYAADADDYLRKGLDARDALRGHPRICTALAPHAPYTISDRTFARVLTYAEQLGINIHLHLQETQGEIARSEAEFGLRPLQRLAALSLLAPNLVAAHCVHLADNEIETLAYHGCRVAHCPTSNLKLGSGIAPVARMLAAGVNVGLGTDGAASNNRLDLLAEMRLAALLAKSSGDAACLPATQALEMATLNGARALGLEHDIGSIETGKLADLVAVDFSALQMQPCYDPLSHLVYVAGREQISHVWVAGELRYKNGIHAHLDQDELREMTARWQEKLKPFHR